MFEDLSQKLEAVFKKIRGQGRLTEANVSESLREVRRALLDADVNYNVTKQFIDKIKVKALGQEVITSVTPGQLIVKIIHDELVSLMGGVKADMTDAPLPPTIVMICGLQGSGKTTFSAKLAHLLKSKGRHPLLVAADIYRPAAIEQLKQLGMQISVPVYAEEVKNAVSIAEHSIEHARKNARDVVIIDTAGRLHIDEEMMNEVKTIKDHTKPHEILFVVDAMTGQDAVNTAKAFHDKLEFDGVVLTKLDGDTRGGAALSIRSVVERPIKFVSIGEKLDALEPFHPDRMASRILGMGDIVTLVEKAQERFDEQKAEKLEEKLRRSQFTLEDFLDQLQEIKKMGPLNQVLGMLPGMNKLPLDSTVDDTALKSIEAIIRSMTPAERQRPQILNGSRRRRIAMGSGRTIQEVNKLLRQFEEMQKMMKTFSRKGAMKNMARSLKQRMN
ncbi:MAG: signal recognition particle protein [Bacteroidota bacterium]